MQVEILESNLKSGDPMTGQHYVLGKGDRVTVSDETGHLWCSFGWAQDTSGVVPTGERSTKGVRVIVDHAKHGVGDTQPPVKKWWQAF